ncbi:type IV toxin-antitoxin system AbiEi family antitoxin domain-containing protein [Nocardioides sp. 616]|uniref:type IV toxin-antitoxin system AbiEi family antitoxin domain-containing protein n=1 Tax=Nocardioides sp. 616 TaxID=2268090 RepID=UPI000CE3712C|nr:type IV toxin-antitoxin system AbiEi family antitoxin domain-containing protein [Nocardioides sp. 616]
MTAPELVDLENLVFLRRDVLDQGYDDRHIVRMVRCGAWHRIRRGAYVEGEAWRSLSETDRYRLRCRAVLRTAHPSASLSHVSAAIEWGVPVWGVPLDEVHLSRVDGKGGRREAGVVHHRATTPAEHLCDLRDVRVTSPTRCAVEMTSMAGVESALVSVNGLLHLGLTTPGDVAELAHDLRFWPSSIGANLVVRLADPRLESPGETRTAYFMWANHLPKPIPQFQIHDEHGRPFARVDFALPEHGVFIEFDGAAKYQEHRRAGETLEDYVLREKRREERICQLTGWVCLRITWSDLNRPRELALRIRRVLESRIRADQ